MKLEVLIPVLLAIVGGCLTLSVKYPRVSMDVFETLSRAMMQLLLANLFVVIGHAITRYVVTTKFETVLDGRIYSNASGDEASVEFAEHADFAVSRILSAINASNETVVLWLAAIGGGGAVLLLLFTSCTYLSKKIMEHGYALPPIESSPHQESNVECSNGVSGKAQQTVQPDGPASGEPAGQPRR
jgi:hypothetical protein